MMPVTENNVAYDFNIDNKIKINKFSHVTSGKLATYIENFVNTLNFFKKEGYEVNNLYYQRIIEFSEYTLNNIYIDNFRTYEKTNTAIKLATHMLDLSLKHKEINQLLVGFYDLKDDLDKLNIFKE